MSSVADFAVLSQGTDVPQNCSGPVTPSLRDLFFTIEELRAGYICIHVVVLLYLFVVMAILSEKFFVPAIEKFTHDFKISPSVAGAGIMASLASTPTLFNNIIGLFLAHNDIGPSAVVGGSFFNLFFIPALCGFVATKPLKLNVFPMLRDMFFFMASALVLLSVVEDLTVDIYEASVLVFMYILYIVILMFNPCFEKILLKIYESLPEGCRSACKGLAGDNAPCESSNLVNKDLDSDIAMHSAGKSEEKTETTENDSTSEGTKQKPTYRSILAVPTNKCLIVLWIIWLPVLLLFYIIIPDFKRPGWSRVYPLTVLMSLLVIGGTAYLIVWMITILGQTLDAPITVMGMTLLAVGASLPDLFNSIFVAMDGLGPMAMSNALGASMFQMLACNGVPWLIQASMNTDRNVEMTENLTVPLTTLACSSIIPLLFLALSGCQLHRVTALCYFIMYPACLVPAVWYSEVIAKCNQ